MKETIAKALYEIDNGYTKWEKEYPHIRTKYFTYAEAVIEALEADVPTSLMGCLLSDEEMIKVISKELGYEEDSIDLVGIEKEVAKAQLKKVAPYIEAQVKAERERILSGIVEARKKITEEKERQRILEPKDRQAEKAFNSQLKGLQQAIDIVKTGGIR